MNAESIFLDIIVKAGTESILTGMKHLVEYFGSMRFDHRFYGAEDFWYRGIEKEKLNTGAKVQVTGLLSPLGPFMPSHPRAKPGYSTEGWSTVSERLKVLMKQRKYPPPDDPLSSTDYDAIDLVVWGDAITRLRKLREGKIYAGLYNQYGKSFECVPVFLDASNKKQRKVLMDIEWPRLYGNMVTITGIVTKIPSFYEHMGIIYPIETKSYPCYCIEVVSIKILKSEKMVLYSTSWAAAEDGNIVTEFFDFMLPDEVIAGHQRLEKRAAGLKSPTWFYYDYISCPISPKPQGYASLNDIQSNEEL